MNTLENVPLSDHSTMRLGGPARYLVDITDRSQIGEALQFAEQKGVPVIMIGGGSNIIWGDGGFPGLVMVNKIMKFEPYQEDDENLYVTVGAGENWDSVVKRTVDLGYSGIEYLSLIPGSAGGTPVQNVGAYGHEIKEVLTTLEAYDREAKQLVTLRGDDCDFGYRSSRFKGKDKGRFFICSITLHLMKQNPAPPFYAALQKYFEDNDITTFTPQVVRDAVIAIRSSKLPDPAVVANNGSFFANPVVLRDQLEQLRASYPDIPHWMVDDEHVKLSAAWLLEQCGFKDMHDPQTGMATWAKQPLVFVNEHATKTADLLQFKKKVVDAVQQKFGITLVQEPELIG